LKFAESNFYQCLENIPETLAKSSRNTAFCGNFFVEEGKIVKIKKLFKIILYMSASML